MAEAGFLKAIYDSLAGFPLIQAAVGALILFFGLRLMLKADRIKDSAVASTPPPVTEAPAVHLQGTVAYMDLMKEKRDLLRDILDCQRRIAECIRIMRDDTRKQVELLDKIEREQSVQGRAHREH
ncbi:hypothetical protein [Methylobacterium sp. ID0610]|uniref:hypothetical protein n=1 Tax=Methylobacterium carpenticola TaxID=3344827 RepID=UPI0036A3E6ED